MLIWWVFSFSIITESHHPDMEQHWYSKDGIAANASLVHHYGRTDTQAQRYRKELLLQFKYDMRQARTTNITAYIPWLRLISFCIITLDPYSLTNFCIVAQLQDSIAPHPMFNFVVGHLTGLLLIALLVYWMTPFCWLAHGCFLLHCKILCLFTRDRAQTKRETEMNVRIMIVA